MDPLIVEAFKVTLEDNMGAYGSALQNYGTQLAFNKVTDDQEGPPSLSTST